MLSSFPTHEPEPPATSHFQTADVGKDVDAVEITLVVEAEVEVVSHITSSKILSLQTWEATLAIHGMVLIYRT